MDKRVFTQWNQRIADAVETCGKEQFPTTLTHAIQALIKFDICMVFSYSTFHGARTLHHNMPPDIAQIIADDYVAGPYLLDPFFNAVEQGRRSGFGAMRELAPDRFYHSEFYQYHYVRTGIADEIGIFFELPNDTTAVLSITRQEDKRLFSQAERQLFAQTAPMVEFLGKRHWSKVQEKLTASKKIDELPDKLDAAYDSFARDKLTAREREVVSLVLKGHSSLSIGHVLNISAGTVKIHRKNAYEKLNISSQAQLFSAFLAYLQTGILNS